jgi:hypothetical protein
MPNLARFLWTLAFWAKTQQQRFRCSSKVALDRTPNIHTPLVMVMALFPGFGPIAYLVARPLRHKLLIRLMLDQMASPLASTAVCAWLNGWPRQLNFRKGRVPAIFVH